MHDASDYSYQEHASCEYESNKFRWQFAFKFQRYLLESIFGSMGDKNGRKWGGGGLESLERDTNIVAILEIQTGESNVYELELFRLFLTCKHAHVVGKNEDKS